MEWIKAEAEAMAKAKSFAAKQKLICHQNERLQFDAEAGDAEREISFLHVREKKQ